LYYLYKIFTWYPDNIARWKSGLLEAARKEVAKFQPDIIFASGPPYTQLLTAAAISQETGIPWVCELRDLWVDNHNYPYTTWRRRIEEKLETRTLSTASAFITVSEPLAEKIRRKYKAPVHVVPNGFDPPDFPDKRSNTFSAEKLHLAYTGFIYSGKQDIRPLLEAISIVKQSAKSVVLHLYGRSLGDVVEQAKVLNISDSVHYHGVVPYRESLDAQRSVDALVFLNWNDAQQTGVYSGKLFEYLGARRPIVCVGTTPTVASDLILERKAGCFSDEPAELAQFLMQLYDEKQDKGGIADSPDTVSAGFTRQEQTAQIRRILQAAATPHGLC